MSTPTPAVLKFEVDQPQVLALAYPTGKPSKSRWSGDQLMYTTTTGDRFFVDPYVGERITAAGIGTGEPFEIVKRETWAGNRRVAEMVVKKIGASSCSAPAPERVVQPSPNSTPAPPPLPPVLPPPMMNGAGETSAAVLARCYHQAIDIALAATAYAESKGLRITPAFEDIRALAATICINESGRR